MIVPFEHTADEPDFRQLLLDHFPELEDEIEDAGGLIYVEMGSLERLANRSIKSGDLSKLKRIYKFVGDMARHRPEVHPYIVNVINVSFLEGLNFAERNHGEEARSLLPDVLLKMWNAQMEHNRKIGWMD
jgi:hypothetical protein